MWGTIGFSTIILRVFSFFTRACKCWSGFARLNAFEVMFWVKYWAFSSCEDLRSFSEPAAPLRRDDSLLILAVEYTTPEKYVEAHCLRDGGGSPRID